MGDQGYGIDRAVAGRIAKEIRDIRALGVELAIVIGGGNIFRGVAASASGMDRAQADYMGMIATVINALALQDALEDEGVVTRVLTAIEMRSVAEPFIRRRAIRHLEKGRVVIFAAGTGNPYFSTDTAAALRAMEIGAEAILKATKVDGIYDSDPMLNPSAKLFETLTYREVLEKGRVVVFAGGTGNPYFTTDTAAALRAMEMKAEVILKATKVDGIYSADPVTNPGATKFDALSYMDVLDRGLRVMDATAISLCMDNRMRIIVFNLLRPGNMRRAILGEAIGTTVGA